MTTNLSFQLVAIFVIFLMAFVSSSNSDTSSECSMDLGILGSITSDQSFNCTKLKVDNHLAVTAKLMPSQLSGTFKIKVGLAGANEYETDFGTSLNLDEVLFCEDGCIAVCNPPCYYQINFYFSANSTATFPPDTRILIGNSSSFFSLLLAFVIITFLFF